MMNHDITKSITTRYNHQQLLFTELFLKKGKGNVFVLNRNIPKELLRKELNRRGYRKSADRILNAGILLPKGTIKEITFDEEATIVTHVDWEQMWIPCHKGDTVKFYPDGSFEKVPTEEVEESRREEKMKDIVDVFLEGFDTLSTFAKKVEKHLPLPSRM